MIKAIYFADERDSNIWRLYFESKLQHDGLVLASDGYSHTINQMDEFFKSEHSFAIFTNCVHLLDFKYVANTSDVFLWCDGRWVSFQSLVDKELRTGHNLELMYRRNVFNKEEQ
jgi:hypothetical protein